MFIASGFTFICSHQGPNIGKLNTHSILSHKIKKKQTKKRCNWGLKPNEMKQEIKSNQGLKLKKALQQQTSSVLCRVPKDCSVFFTTQVNRPNNNNNRAKRTFASLERINRKVVFKPGWIISSRLYLCVEVVKLVSLLSVSGNRQKPSCQSTARLLTTSHSLLIAPNDRFLRTRNPLSPLIINPCAPLVYTSIQYAQPVN